MRDEDIQFADEDTEEEEMGGFSPNAPLRPKVKISTYTELCGSSADT